MDNDGNTSLQDLLTLVTSSLKEAEEALGAPEPKPTTINCEAITLYTTRYPLASSEPVQTSALSRVVYADGEKDVSFYVYAVNNKDLVSSNSSATIRSGPLKPQVAPTELSIQADNSSCVTISWKPPQWPNGVITGYQYKPNAESGTQWTDIGDVKSKQICQYTPYEKVQCQIRAMNSAGNSDTATTDEIRTDCTAPTSPGSLQFGNPEETNTGSKLRLKYTVTWMEPSETNCESISSYSTRYPASGSNVAPRSVTNRVVYADGNIPIEFHVTAVNNYNLESAAAVISITTPEMRPQLSPVYFNMRVDSPKCVTLSWEPPNWPNGPITGYQYKCKDEGSWTDILDSADKREYQLCHFSPYQVVECELRAVNSAGNSNSSTAPSVTTDCDVSTAPGNLKFSDPEEENNEGRQRLKYKVTWKEPDAINCAEIKSYIITYPKSTSESESVQNSVFNQVVYADGEEEITFSVYAVNNADFESVVRINNYYDYDTESRIILLYTGPQIAPTNVSVQADNSSCVTVSWKPPLWPNGRITGYQYKPNTETGTQWTNTGDVRSVQICQYSPYESVQCEIRARNSAGKSDTATTDEIRTDCTASSVPQDVTFGQPNIVQRSGRDMLMYTVKWQEPKYINCESVTSYNTRYPALDSNVTFRSATSRDVYADGNRPVEFHVTAVNNDNLESATVVISITTPEIQYRSPALSQVFLHNCHQFKMCNHFMAASSMAQRTNHRISG
ncbi:receptor-type tyrosine-protein phosphatase delta-like [Watersipora subatra]|uniref:receptor-type tyrosine-protein phosphatase delta-like n=1 Tax=Watersipora subatra TaxID=2589382 RepID=UPI00355B609C